MPTQMFTYKSAPFKMADTFSIEKGVGYGVLIANIRLLDGKIVADMRFIDSIKTTVNKSTSSESRGLNFVNQVNLDNLINNPIEFLKANNCSTEDLTFAYFILNVATLPNDAPQAVKDFYKTKLNADALKGYCSQIEKELKQQRQNTKIEGELKKTLTQQILKSYSYNKGMHLFKSILIGLLLTMTIFTLSAIASSFALPAMLILSAEIVALLTVPFITVKIASEPFKQQAVALNQLGELDNEEIDSIDGVAHLVTKLAPLLETDKEKISSVKHDNVFSIDIGETSYHSYFEQFKSFFSKKAYDVGYYIGQEIAAKNARAVPK